MTELGTRLLFGFATTCFHSVGGEKNTTIGARGEENGDGCALTVLVFSVYIFIYSCTCKFLSIQSFVATWSLIVWKFIKPVLKKNVYYGSYRLGVVIREKI